MLNEWLDRWGLVLNRVSFLRLSFALIGRERRVARDGLEDDGVSRACGYGVYSTVVSLTQ